jgi:dipeptidyl aminopeptidase/acylaminoacyl peptidase
MPLPARRGRRRNLRATTKAPLSSEARVGLTSASQRRRSRRTARSVRAVTSSTWTRTRARPSSAYLDGIRGQRQTPEARRLTAGDKDSDPKWSPDGRWIAFTAKRKDDDEAQVYVIAPDGGEASAHDARERRSASSGFPTAAASRSSRGSGRTSRPTRDRRSAEGAQGREGQGARHRARRVSLLGPLADRRTRAARVRVRHRDGPLPRRARGHRLALPPWDPTARLRHRAGRARDRVTVDLAPSRR